MANPLDFIKTIKNITDQINSTQTFALPLLVSKIRKTAQENPNDQTLRVITTVLSKMSENGKIFITRAELCDVYSKFATNSTMAYNFFNSHGILEKEEELPQRQLAGNIDKSSYDQTELANKKVANSLSGLWDEQGVPKKDSVDTRYDPTMAMQAKTITNLELSRLGCQPKAVKTFAGTSDLIICDAVYETSRGEAHILIPVELSKSGVLIPTLFLSRFGATELKPNALKDCILDSGGRNLQINAEQLLNVVSTVKEATNLSELELRKLITANSDNSEIVFNKQAAIQEINKQAQNAPIQPKIENTESFDSYLNSCKGLAEITFGKTAVENGRNMIINKMASFGYKAQVSVSSSYDDSIMYAVGFDSAKGPIGFEVVAEVKGDKVNIPTIAAIKESVFDFTRAGIDNIAISAVSDSEMLAKVSPVYSLKPSEILETMKRAADKGDYKTAEDALNVLNQTADHETYIKAMAEYMRSINTNGNVVKQASNESKCSMIIRTATHNGPVCGHLNLPLDKVYQNKYGECVPKYRQSMDDTYEGMMFHTSKIFNI